jgi:hypothetical protein
MSYESANACPLPALRIRFPTGPLSDSLPGKDAPARSKSYDEASRQKAGDVGFGGASLVRPWPRFHTPLVEPDRQISRIRLSDKTSRLHPRHVVPRRLRRTRPKWPYRCESCVCRKLDSAILMVKAAKDRS